MLQRTQLTQRQIRRTVARVARRSTRRPGLSVLEVLVSVGIIGIGIFGVLAILPLAGYQTQQALTLNHTATYGESAYDTFYVRRMGDPRNWLWVNDNDQVVPAAPFLPQAVCIDPRMVGASYERANANPPTGVLHDGNYFPYVFQANPSPPPVFQINEVAMARLSLRSQAGGAIMQRTLANEIFQTSDDLVMLEQQGGLSPLQEFTTGNAKRQSQGNLSWFAMLVPRYRNPQADLYTLSIVIVRQRNKSLDPTDPMSERVADVVGFPGQGTGGGDVDLRSRTGVPSEVEVRRGDWIMLARYTGIDPNNNNPLNPIFKWYQVTRADDVDPAALTRTVRLEGPDWLPDPSNTLPTIAILVEGVVAVYERTIRLEDTTLWTRN